MHSKRVHRPLVGLSLEKKSFQMRFISRSSLEDHDPTRRGKCLNNNSEGTNRAEEFHPPLKSEKLLIAISGRNQ